MANGRSKMSQNQVEILQDDQPLNPYTEIQILPDHTDLIKFLLQISENKFLSVSDDNTGIIWDIITCLKCSMLVGHTRPITCATLVEPTSDDRPPGAEVPPSSPFLLTGSSDKTIRLWSTETGTCLRVISEHNATTKAILSFPKSGLFCTGGQELFLWNSQRQLLHQVSQESEAGNSDCPLADIKHMLAIPDDRFIVAAGCALEVYAIDTQIGQLGVTSYQLRRVKKLAPQHREAVMCLTSVSDSYFASASLDGTVKVWNTRTLGTSRQLNHIKDYERNGFPWCVRHMLPLDKNHLCVTIGSGLAIFDIISGDCLWKQLKAHYSKITFVSVVYDGKFLATCSEDGMVRLWGVDTRLKVAEEGDYSGEEFSLHKFDSIVQASRQSKETRRLFRREESRPPILCLQGECVAHSGAVQMVLDFREEGMVSCGADGLVILWKDGVTESNKRNDVIREMLHARSGLF
ncbi:WD repeat-containing protein 41-like [Diadema antillarum]|uniref:WD repeat-containing protein 41-like n=1 Tax=Diadema antillarum TaxID=105358 RepID=UPI003A83C844